MHTQITTSVQSILKIRVPQSALWSMLIGIGISFCATQFGNAIHTSYSKEVAVLHENHAAFGGMRSEVLHTAAPQETPAFECAIAPFGYSPHWGAMQSATDLQRGFHDMSVQDFTAVPEYNIQKLVVPLEELNAMSRTNAVQENITAKLYYSTRYMGEYHLDSDEYVSSHHPAIDFKMPEDTPIRAIAAGTVHDVRKSKKGLGHYIIIEHQLSRSEKIFSIYGHMKDIIVTRGQKLNTGDIIGTVGSTGNSTLPHLHLQIDRDRGLNVHEPYIAPPGALKSDVMRWTIHPMEFINKY